MVSAKNAVAAAATFATEVLDPGQTVDIRLEELESGADAYFVTLSMRSPAEISPIAFIGSARDYRVFTVDRETGEVRAMKIREKTAA